MGVKSGMSVTCLISTKTTVDRLDEQSGSIVANRRGSVYDSSYAKDLFIDFVPEEMWKSFNQFQ